MSRLFARRRSEQRRSGTSRPATQEEQAATRDVVGRRRRRRRTLVRPSRHSEDLRTRCGDDWGEEASAGDCNTDVPLPSSHAGTDRHGRGPTGGCTYRAAERRAYRRYRGTTPRQKEEQCCPRAVTQALNADDSSSCLLLVRSHAERANTRTDSDHNAPAQRDPSTCCACRVSKTTSAFEHCAHRRAASAA